MKYILSVLMMVFLSTFLFAATPKHMMKGMKPQAAAKKAGEKVEKKTQKVKCPVTGSYFVPDKASPKVVYNGKTYYFCCSGCPEEFAKDPEKYIKSKALDKKH